jgi:hypothetical protein
MITLRGRFTPEAIADLIAVSRALQASQYPAIRRANAAHNANVNVPAPKTLDGVAKALRSKDWVAELDLAVQAVRDDPHGGAEEYVFLAELSQVFFGQVPGAREKAYEAFRDALGDVPNADTLRPWLKGKFLLGRGWATRGGAIAALVPNEKMRSFGDDLVAAADALEAAWDLDPTQPDIAVARMTAAGPTGDFEDLEAWFRKAMTADGDCSKAVRRKGEFLHPKWGGSQEALRNFADRLVATRNWDAMLPLEAIGVLGRMNMPGLGAQFVDRDWATVERILDEYLKMHPDSRWAWSLMAQAAAQPFRPAAILRAAEHLGDKPSRVVFAPGEFEALLKQAQAAKR